MRKLYFTDQEIKNARLESLKKYYSSEKGKKKKQEYDILYRASMMIFLIYGRHLLKNEYFID